MRTIKSMEEKERTECRVDGVVEHLNTATGIICSIIVSYLMMPAILPFRLRLMKER